MNRSVSREPFRLPAGASIVETTRRRLSLLSVQIFFLVIYWTWPAGTFAASSEATKVEPEVMWYTTMALDDSSVLVGKFNREHPAITVKLFRANNAKILERILAESRAKSAIADVVSASALPIGVLKERGALAKYISSESAAFPSGARDVDGFWTDTYVNTFNLVYNTTMVSAKDAPKNYEAVLDSRWRGNIGLDDTDYEWFGNMLQIMGEE